MAMGSTCSSIWASDAPGFAALAALVRPGGIALTTRYVADEEALTAQGVAGVSLQVAATAEALDQIGNLVPEGSVVVPPISVITLDEVLPRGGATPVKGKAVITL
jgi:hypothetical protein